MPVSQHSSISARLEQRHLYTTDALLDALLALYDDCEAYQRTNRQETIGEFLSQFQKVEKQLRAARINKNDFEVIRPLANGLFGIVSVVRSKLDGNVYAMKVLSKDPLLQQQQKAFSMEERLVLSHPDANHWMPVLHAAFQDVDNLYLVMEYAGGGDLFSVLDRKENLCLNEDEARFYMAETILAVDSLHALGYVHRDIKPQNILIDNSGHVKLADFGSCIRIDHCSKIPPTTPVGTCDYVSPEVLESQQGNVTYGTEVDWWSVGIVLYEVLQENPPFYSRDSESETYRKIIFHQSSLKFNDDIPISEEAKDLICKLLCKKEDRLGKNGIQEIQHHPFFKGIDWENIRGATPPFLPVLSSPDDTSNFSVPEEDTVPTITSEQTNNTGVYEGRSLPFIGYTYSSLMPNTTKDILPSMKDDIANLRQLNDPQLRLKDMLSDTIYTEEVHNAVNPKVDQLEQDNTKLKLTVTELEDRIKSLEEISNQQACELQIWKEQELQQKSDRSQKEASLSNLLQTIQALTNDTAKLENEKNNALQELENETSQRIELKENLEKEILDHEQTKQHLKLTSTQLQSHKKDNTVHETQHQDYIQHLANVEKSLEDLHNEKETLVCAITAERKECQLLRALAKSTQLTAASLRIELENLRREFKTVGKTRQIAKTLPALPTLEPNAPEQGRSMILSIMWRKDRETIRQLEKALEESENALHDAKRDLSRLHKDALQPQHRITETVTVSRLFQSNDQDKREDKVYSKKQGWFSQGSSPRGPLRITTSTRPSSKDFQAFYVQYKNGNLLAFKNKPSNCEKLERQLPDIRIPIASPTVLIQPVQSNELAFLNPSQAECTFSIRVLDSLSCASESTVSTTITRPMSHDSSIQLARIDSQLKLEESYMEGAKKTLEARSRLINGLRASGMNTSSEEQQRKIHKELEHAILMATKKICQLTLKRQQLINKTSFQQSNATKHHSFERIEGSDVHCLICHDEQATIICTECGYSRHDWCIDYPLACDDYRKLMQEKPYYLMAADKTEQKWWLRSLGREQKNSSKYPSDTSMERERASLAI